MATSSRKRTLTTPQFSSSSSFLLEARIAKLGFSLEKKVKEIKEMRK